MKSGTACEGPPGVKISRPSTGAQHEGGRNAEVVRRGEHGGQFQRIAGIGAPGGAPDGGGGDDRTQRL